MHENASPPSRLITIGLSHYCEKARWALDRMGIPYREDAYPPLLHVLPVKLSGGKQTPVLVTSEHTFKDSTDILHYVDRVSPAEHRLYPDDPAQKKEVEELEDLFDETLGPHVRRWAYQQIMRDRAVFIEAISSKASPRGRTAMRVMAPLVEKLIRGSLRIDEEGARRSEVKVRDVLTRIDTRLSDGRKFLVGNRFTAADLTLAALAGPILLPPEYGAPYPSIERVPAELARAIEGYRQTETGQLVLRLYRDERGRVVTKGAKEKSSSSSDGAAAAGSDSTAAPSA